MIASLLRQPVRVRARATAAAGGVRVCPSFTQRNFSNAFAFNSVTTSRLKDASFTVEEGAKVCVTGPNEKAKSDILKLLSGDLQPTSGSVEIPKQRTIFSYSQTVSKGSLCLTVGEYLDGQRESGEEVCLDEVVEHTGLKTIPSTSLVSDLTSSQRCRLQFAVALLHSPDVLLLENPTKIKHGVMSDEEVKKLIEAILRFPKTCVVSSTDGDFLNSFCDHVVHVGEDSGVEVFVGSYTNAQNAIAERDLPDEKELTTRDVWFGMFLLFLLCPFEAMLFFYYQ